MRLRFDGGADTVTGSTVWIEANGHRLLRDCGLFQGPRRAAFERNRSFGFKPADLAGVVLSHAHIDHCGNLPSLVRAGFEGPIHATHATADLCGIMLRDAAHIQEQDAAYLNQKTNRRGLPPVEPLYTTADAEKTLRLLHGHAYGQTVEIVPGVELTGVEAGHVLGAELSLLRFEEHGRRLRVAFAVDLGRRNLPLLRDPEVIVEADLLVLESTYGDRDHADARTARERLGAVVRTTLGRGGKLFIPSFALERTQEILYHLYMLQVDGQIQPPCVYVDSPMAGAVTRVFERHLELFDEEARDLHRRMGSLFPPWVRFTSTVEESKQITASNAPCIVLAGSGMCEHGRILHHLKHGIENPRNAIAIVGFQAAHTLGRRLVEGERRVRVFGDEFEVRAEVHVLNAFSAHADQRELLEYVRAARPRRIVLVHGEERARAALAEALRAAQPAPVGLPAAGDVIEL
ncbi:MAG: MBL fold metallo-hydrolase [Kiritimatiellae bacterium]|nr:MBL fold metallo-hydrolase [Kiritimatiellia bacterium]